MKVYNLASGSKGNSTYVEFLSTKILIDLGTDYKYICECLNHLEVNPDEIKYIFFTHTHDDHISALKTFIKHYNPTLVLTKKMYDYLNIDYDNVFIFDDNINDIVINVKAINTSHDSVDSKGYIFEENSETLGYITDTGYINNKYFSDLSNLTYYYFESNHDVDMLINGRYPRWLQKRILSDKGHLSNNSSSYYLAKLIGSNTKKIVLAHLSEENNSPSKALDTLISVFNEYEVSFENVVCAKQKEITEVSI